MGSKPHGTARLDQWYKHPSLTLVEQGCPKIGPITSCAVSERYFCFYFSLKNHTHTHCTPSQNPRHTGVAFASQYKLPWPDHATLSLNIHKWLLLTAICSPSSIRLLWVFPQ